VLAMNMIDSVRLSVTLWLVSCQYDSSYTIIGSSL